MKKSKDLFTKAENEFKLAEIYWKENKSESGKQYICACYGMMRAYLVSEGIMHMEDNNSIYKAYEGILQKETGYIDSYAMEFNYLNSFYNKKGYFKNNPEMDTDLKNDLTKLYEKLKEKAIEIMDNNKDDKIVKPSDIEGFIDNLF